MKHASIPIHKYPDEKPEKSGLYAGLAKGMERYEMSYSVELDKWYFNDAENQWPLVVEYWYEEPSYEECEKTYKKNLWNATMTL